MTLLSLLLLAADPIPVDKAATIERDQQKAQAEVAKKYGNKKPSELSADERREMTRDQIEADRKVLDKHGVDPKEWARDSIRKSRDDYAARKEAVKQLEEKEKAEAAKQAESKKDQEVIVQRGFSDENPVVLEEKQGAPGEVTVEKGLPPEVKEEQDALADHDRLEGMGGASEKPEPAAAKPTKKGKGKRK